jgi:CheY-like chemotaxis protein
MAGHAAEQKLRIATDPEENNSVLVNVQDTGETRGAAFHISLPWTETAALRENPMLDRSDPSAPASFSPRDVHFGGGGTETNVPYRARGNSLNICPMPTRILVAVVDDEESVCRALLRLLRAAGLDVETYSSSLAFLESMRERLPSHRPDCVVLDLHLPGLTGLDVQKQLKNDRIPLPIVMITGNEEEGVQEKVLSEGAFAFLVKPIHARSLLDAIDGAVREAAQTP